MTLELEAIEGKAPDRAALDSAVSMGGLAAWCFFVACASIAVGSWDADAAGPRTRASRSAEPRANPKKKVTMQDPGSLAAWSGPARWHLTPPPITGDGARRGSPDTRRHATEWESDCTALRRRHSVLPGHLDIGLLASITITGCPGSTLSPLALRRVLTGYFGPVRVVRFEALCCAHRRTPTCATARHGQGSTATVP